MKRFPLSTRTLFTYMLFLFCCSTASSPLRAAWNRTNGPYGASISCFARLGTDLFAGSGGSIYVSADSGRTWRATNYNHRDQFVTAIVVSGTELYAATSGGVFRSADQGTTWTAMNTGLANTWVNALAFSGTSIFAGTRGGVFKSADGGATWNPANTGMISPIVNSLAAFGNDLYAATGTGGSNDTGGVWITRDGGANWNPVNVGSPNAFAQKVAVFGTTIFAVEGYYLYRSTDQGATWESIVTGGRTIYSFVQDGSDLYVATSGGVLVSHDDGRSWPPTSIGAPIAYFNTLTIIGPTLVAGTAAGVLRSADKGATWTESGTGLTGLAINALAASGSTLVACAYSGIYISTDRGSSWTNVRTGAFTCLASSGTRLFAGSTSGVFTSTDNGAHWSTTSNAVINPNVTALVVIGSDLFAGTSNGVFFSSNNGGSWNTASYGLRNSNIMELAASGTTLYAGTAYGSMGGGLYMTTDKGWTWKQVRADTVKENTLLLAASGSDLFISKPSGIFRFSLLDSSFTQIKTSAPFFTSSCASGTDLFFGSLDILHTPDQGRTWKSTGFPGGFVNGGLAVLGGELYAGTYDSGVWRRAVSEIVSDVPSAAASLAQAPGGFALSQNYPNPFNPSTTISFRLPARTFVSLAIYNVLGKELCTLQSGELAPGAYSRTWDASALPSGLYFCRLKAGHFSETRKLILNK